MKFSMEDLKENIYYFCVLYGAFALAFVGGAVAPELGFNTGLLFILGLFLGAAIGIWVGKRILDVLER